MNKNVLIFLLILVLFIGIIIGFSIDRLLLKGNFDYTEDSNNLYIDYNFEDINLQDYNLEEFDVNDLNLSDQSNPVSTFYNWCMSNCAWDMVTCLESLTPPEDCRAQYDSCTAQCGQFTAYLQILNGN